MINLREIKNFSNEELIEKLRARNLKTERNRATLIKRLSAAIYLESESLPSEHIEIVNTKNNRPGFHFSFSDIETFLPQYDGSSSIQGWIRMFEEYAELYNWSNFQKLIFGKTCLRGRAEKFLASEGVISSWEQFKNLLQLEFGDELCTAEIHALLDKQKIKPGETM